MVSIFLCRGVRRGISGGFGVSELIEEERFEVAVEEVGGDEGADGGAVGVEEGEV